MSWTLFVFSELRPDVVVCFFDISGIVFLQLQEEFEVTKEVIRIRISKNRQRNGKKTQRSKGQTTIYKV
jgi:hypothetical protein